MQPLRLSGASEARVLRHAGDVSADEWMLAPYGGHKGLSNKGILLLIGLGLYVAAEPDENGWRFRA